MDIYFSQCYFQSGCNSCLSLAHCIFVILMNGEGICLEKNSKDGIGNRVIKSILYDKLLCIHSQSSEEAYQIEDEDQAMDFTALRDWTLPIQQQVREWKLHSYNPEECPPVEDEQPLVISTGLNVSHLQADNSIFYVYGRLRLEWNDTRLAWDPEHQAPGAPPDMTLYYAESEIWWPQIRVKNDDTSSTNVHNGITLINVDHRGRVVWDYSVELASDCKLNMGRWPYDTHQCEIILVMNSFREQNIVDVTELSNKNNLDSIYLALNESIAEWDVLWHSVERKVIKCDDCDDHTIEVQFLFSIRRKGDFHCFLFLCPLIVTIGFLFIVLFAPSADPNWSVVIFIFILLLSTFMMYFKHMLPSYSDGVPPLIAFFCWNHLTLITLSTIQTMFIFSPTKRRSFKRFRNYLVRLCNTVLGFPSRLAWVLVNWGPIMVYIFVSAIIILNCFL